MRTNLATVSNEALLSNLHELVGQGRVLLARLLAHLGEIEERRLDLESACPSLNDFCIRRLGFSEDEAFRRVTAARIGRRFPLALDMIANGELHLTTLLLLRDHLTDDNHEELLRVAAGRTKAQVQALFATRSPRLDVPTRVEPLSSDRYAIQFTASANLKAKIERATALMRHQNPTGDLGLLMDRAVDLLIAELEKTRLGKTMRPPTNPRKSTRRGYITRAVRRAVFERDGEQCTFVDEARHRCEERALLELDHRHARALGGSDEASNLAVRCRRHNGLAAEHDLGRTYIQKKRRERMRSPLQRGSEPALRALTGMGFKEKDAQRALQTVAERTDTELPMTTLLRDAIAVLT